MLYIVSTPIGNLSDITLRALEVLKNSEIILCEDTRHSRILLDRYDIKAKLVSNHKFNEAEKAEWIVQNLREGKEISLITDAGTPIISDPGFYLVKRLKEEGLPYTAIPGACAAVNALVLSGIDSSSFTFLGFIPKSKKRKEFLEDAKDLTTPLIFYISPHGIKEDIEDLYSVFGERKGVLVKEMTKIHEKTIDINLSEGFPDVIKGEMVLVLCGKEKKAVDYSELSPMEHLLGYINSGMEKSEAIKRVAKERGVAKNEIYKLLNR